MWGRISLFLVAALVASLVAGAWLGHVLTRNAPINLTLSASSADGQAMGAIALSDLPEPPQPLVDGSMGVPRRGQASTSVPTISAFDPEEADIVVTYENVAPSTDDPILTLIQSRIGTEVGGHHSPTTEASPGAPTGAPAYSTFGEDAGAAPGFGQAFPEAPDAGTRVGRREAGRTDRARARLRREDLPPELALAVAQPADAPSELPPLATTPAQPAGSNSAAPPSRAPLDQSALNTAGWHSALRSALAQCDAMR